MKKLWNSFVDVWNSFIDLLFYPAEEEEEVEEKTYKYNENDLEVPVFGEGRYSDGELIKGRDEL